MRLTVAQIMSRIGSTVNQDSTAPADTSTEWALWLSYLNRSLQEWSQANDWEIMRKIGHPTVTGMSQATVSLPLDFWKLAAPVRVHMQGDQNTAIGEEFPDVLWEEEGMYNSTDRYVKLTGDLSSGRSFIFHPGTLASGASLEVQYFAMPTSMASPLDVPAMTDSQFLIDRTIAYILESRSDARFQQMESKARERLLQMVENTNLEKFSSYDNTSPVGVGINKKLGFRVGRD